MMEIESKDFKYFAEYLPRIKAVTISVQLPDGCSASKMTFKDVRTALLHYIRDDEQLRGIEELALPEDITVRVSESTYEIEEKTSVFSFRLPASPELAKQPKQTFFEPMIRIPWTAEELCEGGDLTICCANCSATISESSRVRHWKALPSENWAEMMDFWHCHKPDEHSEHFNPGYSMSTFAPYSGTGLVGDSYFFFEKRDLSNVEESSEDIYCKTCTHLLGSKEKDHTNSTVRIWKWSITIRGSNM
jgi:hypothetical protein